MQTSNSEVKVLASYGTVWIFLVTGLFSFIMMFVTPGSGHIAYGYASFVFILLALVRYGVARYIRRTFDDTSPEA